MRTYLFEATQSISGGFANHGKFLVGVFDEEWQMRSLLSDYPIMPYRWDHRSVLVMDLETGEASIFTPEPRKPASNFCKASYDLNEKHSIWVCPMFEPFLDWLYQQELAKIDSLPRLVELPDAPFAFSGYRRLAKGRNAVIRTTQGLRRASVTRSTLSLVPRRTGS